MHRASCTYDGTPSPASNQPHQLPMNVDDDDDANACPRFNAYVSALVKSCTRYLEKVVRAERIEQILYARSLYVLNMYVKRQTDKRVIVSQFGRNAFSLGALYYVLSALNNWRVVNTTKCPSKAADYKYHLLRTYADESQDTKGRLYAAIDSLRERVGVRADQEMAYRHIPTLRTTLLLPSGTGVASGDELDLFIQCTEYMINDSYRTPVSAYYTPRDICLACSYIVLKWLRAEPDTRLDVTCKSLMAYNTLLKERLREIEQIVDHIVKHSLVQVPAE